MKRCYFMLLIIFFYASGCKQKSTAPVDLSSNGIIIVEGNIVYEAYSRMAHPVGGPKLPDGYYLTNRQWITQVSDTCDVTLLSGKINIPDTSAKVIVQGQDSVVIYGGSFGPFRLMKLEIDTIQTIN